MRPAIKKTAVPAGEIAISSEPQDAKRQTNIGDFHPADSVGQIARDDDEDAGK